MPSHAPERAKDTRPYGVSQQELEEAVGVDRRFLCAPASLLHLARLHGHDMDPVTFARGLDFAYWNDVTRGWSRAGLARMMRDGYGTSSVSWWSQATGRTPTRHDLARMKRAGYVDSPLEISFLTEVVGSLPRGASGVMALAKMDIPVAVTMLPGFGENRSAHAVVLESCDPGTGAFRVFDPDDRNREWSYPPELIASYLAPAGACTVVLP